MRKCCRKVVSSVHYFLVHLQVCNLFPVILNKIRLFENPIDIGYPPEFVGNDFEMLLSN